ncbi:class B sortase [Romboutsia lituseburensis]|uniref:class B sortase n=1 Tax=Romboutsia lituseburensis TaxID=1537 RepID=UPI00215A497C|nr:class B sortase [Romboutsia lituseburensis]MCR8743723.1 class B sortase [Romboutsia lituseburensis]
MNNIRKILNIILIGILLFSSYKILNKSIQYKKADKVYTQIKEIKKNITLNNNNKTNKKALDLSSINSDYRGWININNTNIDYPILQAKDNEYYLKKDINKSNLASGSIFLDFRNNKFSDKNTIIYGHYMKNDTMFGELKYFKNPNFFNKNNKIIITTSNNKVLKYQVFSVYVTDANDNYIQTNFENDYKYEEFLDKISNKSLFDNNSNVNTSDRILTLSTCSYEFENARMVIHAKLL